MFARCCLADQNVSVREGCRWIKGGIWWCVKTKHMSSKTNTLKKTPSSTTNRKNYNTYHTTTTTTTHGEGFLPSSWFSRWLLRYDQASDGWRFLFQFLLLSFAYFHPTFTLGFNWFILFFFFFFFSCTITHGTVAEGAAVVIVEKKQRKDDY